MFKLSHSKMAFFSGAIWMAIGVFLLQLGLNLLFKPAAAGESIPLLNLLLGFISATEAAILITVVALYIGFLKGKYILTKTANRTLDQIRSLPNPGPLHQIYDKKYYILIGIMVMLGMSIKYMGIPNDIRGAIDVIIGSALINGAAYYFRAGFQIQHQQEKSVL
ncbi:MAG: hypothetical protein H0W50_07130 [Parachlamydiaceae bacterium]|nr:hypothetical protein [Parachlamydiaceae bacterium]